MNGEYYESIFWTHVTGDVRCASGELNSAVDWLSSVVLLICRNMHGDADELLGGGGRSLPLTWGKDSQDKVEATLIHAVVAPTHYSAKHFTCHRNALLFSVIYGIISFY